MAVGTSEGYIFMLDMSSGTVLNKFDKYGGGITNILWLKYEPGTFVTTTKNSGRAVFYNVSKKSYKEISKVADSPVIYGCYMPDDDKVLFSLENGSVIIFDMKHRKKSFMLPPGHSETIFDLEYSPTNVDTFATSSYDGSIKVWDLKSDKISCHFKINEDKKTSNSDSDKCSIFCLRWHRTDKNLILCGDSKATIRVLDLSKQKVVSQLKLSNKESHHVVGIDWEADNTVLATSADMIFVCKYESTLSIVKSIKSTGVLFQIKFDPFDSKNFAVGCLDNTIRIHANHEDRAVKVLSGHVKKVYGISYNPKRRGILASSGDDTKIGVWDLNTGKNFFMSGHKNNTRQLLWMENFPNILISGSWDGTIRLWNVDLAECVYMINEHYSDVYGLDICPGHPFLLTSSSRDNSVRFWNIISVCHNYVKFIHYLFLDPIHSQL